MSGELRHARVSVVGLGRLGAPWAACLAARGATVVGVDRDSSRVAAVESRRSPFCEPRLEALLEAAGDRLRTESDLVRAVAATDVTFIAVATPSEPSGAYSIEDVLVAAEQIGKTISTKRGRHLIAVMSTVMPGTTGGPVKEVLERTSGGTCAVDFGLCYTPALVALGSVVHDFLEPELLLIGESDPRSGREIESLLLAACDSKPAVARTALVNAEIAKLSIACFVTARIGFANTIARICEGLPGADVDEVTSALVCDSRVGTRPLRGAVSYGGPCFPRDNAAMAALAASVGAPAALPRAVDAFNREQIGWLADTVVARLPHRGRVGVLGLAYKAGTDVWTEAPGLLLCRHLSGIGVRVMATDGRAEPGVGMDAPEGVRIVEDPESCIEGADVVVVTTPEPAWRALPLEVWSRRGTPRTVIDCWRMLDHLADCPGVDLVSLGRGQARGC